jgi:hypothetical protein
MIEDDDLLKMDGYEFNMLGSGMGEYTPCFLDTSLTEI